MADEAKPKKEKAPHKEAKAQAPAADKAEAKAPADSQKAAPGKPGEAPKAAEPAAPAPVVAAPEAVAEKLRIARGDEVQRATRVWYAEAGPFNHLSTFVPATLGRRWRRKDLETKTLVALLEDSGVKISRAEENITATLADEVNAPPLEVEVGSALLKITRTVFGEYDQAVEYLVALYPPDRYQYTVSLGRDPELDSALRPLKKAKGR